MGLNVPYDIIFLSLLGTHRYRMFFSIADRYISYVCDTSSSECLQFSMMSDARSVQGVLEKAGDIGMVLKYDPSGNKNRCFYQCLAKFLVMKEVQVIEMLECYMLNNDSIPTKNEDGDIVHAFLYDFMTDKDFPLNGYKRPASWEEAVFAMRNEMATHPVILAAATLFNIEINIVDWIGRLTTTEPPSHKPKRKVHLAYTGFAAR
ncbi:hypothetical protein QZH41_011469 [Actinostola sp. cb2023]|nr:hypothetical protein QZH41_011469 [Actinostola sp. cb2023]